MIGFQEAYINTTLNKGISTKQVLETKRKIP